MSTKVAEGYADPLAQPQNRAMAEVLKRIGAFGVGAFGVGAGIAGVQGLGDLVGGTTGDPPKVPLRRQFIDVPIARRKPREEEGPLRALAKQAEAIAPPDFWVKNVTGPILNAAGAFNKNMGPVMTGLVNPMAKEWHQHPWAVPAAIAAGTVGVMGGHAVADAAIGKARANEDDSELEQAKQRYEHALGGKLAGVDVYAGLDAVWDAIEATEKTASMWDDASGPIALAATGMGATALASGVMAYNYARDRAPDKAVERALKERRERLFAAGPPALVAMPREADEPDDNSPRIDLGAVRRKIDAYRTPKAAGLPPAQAGNAVIGQLHTQAEQTRLRARAALGIKEEVVKPAPTAEPTPHQPPSVAQGLAKPV